MSLKYLHTIFSHSQQSNALSTWFIWRVVPPAWIPVHSQTPVHYVRTTKWMAVFALLVSHVDMRTFSFTVYLEEKSSVFPLTLPSKYILFTIKIYNFNDTYSRFRNCIWWCFKEGLYPSTWMSVQARQSLQHWGGLQTGLVWMVCQMLQIIHCASR